MSNAEIFNVALFPIPNVVAFPGTVLPLHVFEPRYRKLVHDCVKMNRMIGVCHTSKTIHEASKNQTMEQALSSNQATYKPREVFSAGYCNVVETTPDGRILAEIMISQRMSLLEEIQLLPYRVVACEHLLDDETPAEQDKCSYLQELINNKLIALIGAQHPDTVQALQDQAWTSLSADDFSFKIFQFLHFDAEDMQAILESRDPLNRLEMTWELLRRA